MVHSDHDFYIPAILVLETKSKPPLLLRLHYAHHDIILLLT